MEAIGKCSKEIPLPGDGGGNWRWPELKELIKKVRKLRSSWQSSWKRPSKFRRRI